MHERDARLTVRWRPVAIAPPRHAKARSKLAPIKLTAILVEEDVSLVPHEQLTPDFEPVRWQLLTTVPVPEAQKAVECVGWYVQRWKIERFHFVLKSGCGIEKLQLEHADRLERALALYSVVAWRVLNLTYASRTNPDAPCTQVLDDSEWKALYITTHRTRTWPKEPPTIREAVRWIAALGGFLGRKGDGEPGTKVIWRGLQRLHDITDSFLLFSQLSNSKIVGNG